MGLTLAYLTGLLLIHVPGGLVHFLNLAYPHNAGGHCGLASIRHRCTIFLVGIVFPKSNPRHVVAYRFRRGSSVSRFITLVSGASVWCQADLRIFSVSSLFFSIGAVVSTGSYLDARCAVGSLYTRHPHQWLVGWLGASLIYPVLTLFLGGLSYGTAGLINALSVLKVTSRRFWQVVLAYGLALLLALSFFTSYFQNRDAIRDAVWSGASLEQRLAAASGVIRDFLI